MSIRSNISYDMVVEMDCVLLGFKKQDNAG